MKFGYIHKCEIQKKEKQQKFKYSSSAGTADVAQTVSGADASAIITKLGSGYIVVKEISGTFINTEEITTDSFSATLDSQSDYRNQSGEYQYYWNADQESVPCRFYYEKRTLGRGVEILDSGQYVNQPLKLAVSNNATINELEYRIVSVVTGFAGTFLISVLHPHSGMIGIDHFEMILNEAL